MFRRRDARAQRRMGSLEEERVSADSIVRASKECFEQWRASAPLRQSLL
ncbi:hypothetical protein RISK_001579 [Rhodopirellula islandica]|uniref:Uncharacterized protein n=1 Tax=Rhodopirellula islandica TaxID=595434 RepID=A0A0J1BIT4_RHOIS|nr:hypothetical protein RISK_001579 [Rhodopirellula islandica]